jgi:hypothetical protein
MVSSSRRRAARRGRIGNWIRVSRPEAGQDPTVQEEGPGVGRVEEEIDLSRHRGSARDLPKTCARRATVFVPGQTKQSG